MVSAIASSGLDRWRRCGNDAGLGWRKNATLVYVLAGTSTVALLAMLVAVGDLRGGAVQARRRAGMQPGRSSHVNAGRGPAVRALKPAARRVGRARRAAAAPRQPDPGAAGRRPGRRSAGLGLDLAQGPPTPASPSSAGLARRPGRGLRRPAPSRRRGAVPSWPRRRRPSALGCAWSIVLDQPAARRYKQRPDPCAPTSKPGASATDAVEPRR